MNELIIRIIVVAAIALGLGTFLVLQRSAFPEPQQILIPEEDFSELTFLLGINPINYMDGPAEQDVEEAASLGAKSIRIWVQWRKIEAEKDKLDWSSLDKIVAWSKQKRVEPWFLVVGAPQHACKGGELDDNADRLCPPKIEPYKVFLTKLVERYQGRVRYYEIWNEPDDEYYWITGPKAEEYAELLRVSHAIIKGIDNNIQVVMAATAGTNLPYLRQVLEHLGGKPAFDAIASHPYRPSPEPPHYMTAGPDERSWRELPEGGGAGVEVNLKEELLLYQDLLRRYGYKDVPHWITEFGYPGHDGRASPAYLTLQRQADFVRRTIELLRDDPELKFVKGVFWWTDRDLDIELPDPIPLDYFAYFDLIAADGTWKPAAKVFKELATQPSEEVGSQKPSQKTTAKRAGDERFGVMLGGYDSIWPDDFERAASIGAGVARIQIWWPNVESSRGKFDFSEFEQHLDAAEKHGILPIVNVWGSPAWACAVPGATGKDLEICPPRPDAFQKFMQTLTSRYRDRVSVWEIWNEPEQPTYWLNAPDAAAYAQLLHAAYQGAKRGNPKATVLFAATGYIQFDYVEQVLRHLGGEAAFDAVAVHPYRFPTGPNEPVDHNIVPGEKMTLKDELVGLLDLFESYGYGRPDLYLTEIGWGSNHASDDPKLNTLEEQAQHVYDTIKLFQNDPELQNVKAVTFFIEILCWIPPSLLGGGKQRFAAGESRRYNTRSELRQTRQARGLRPQI
ncbi:hypothetical protein LM602_03405, partial [Candidatus Acetothermia bacterium]|nr:hypothetical protein [Candidatus Acetothermia bacterium]